MFDERQLHRHNIFRAVDRYMSTQPKHSPARSAFLLIEGQRLPAKYILRLAFEDLIGRAPVPEQLTGGRASVRVLRNLGFEAIYEKPPTKNRNAVKNARREAFRKVLAERWGEVTTEARIPELVVPNLTSRSQMPQLLIPVLDAIESLRGLRVHGRERHALCCDLYLVENKAIIEFDERQHFTDARAASLRSYPCDAKLGFDKGRWIGLAKEIRAGDNSPIYRDEQRAFYDAVRDLMAVNVGLKPVIRVYENDVAWERESSESPAARAVLEQIEHVAR